jgi:hypothetical protein
MRRLRERRFWEGGPTRKGGHRPLVPYLPAEVEDVAIEVLEALVGKDWESFR